MMYDIIDYGITDDQSVIDAILKASLPLIPAKIEVPDYGCTSFTLTDIEGDVHMGRNYDFRKDTLAMLVRCNPTGTRQGCDYGGSSCSLKRI